MFGCRHWVEQTGWNRYQLGSGGSQSTAAELHTSTHFGLQLQALEELHMHNIKQRLELLITTWCSIRKQQAAHHVAYTTTMANGFTNGYLSSKNQCYQETHMQFKAEYSTFLIAWVEATQVPVDYMYTDLLYTISHEAGNARNLQLSQIVSWYQITNTALLSTVSKTAHVSTCHIVGQDPTNLMWWQWQKSNATTYNVQSIDTEEPTVCSVLEIF